MDRPRWSDAVAGQMEGYAGWWTKTGMIGLPPQTMVNGVGRHNNEWVCEFTFALDIMQKPDKLNTKLQGKGEFTHELHET